MKGRESCVGRGLRYLAVFSFLLVPLAVIPILAGWVGDVAKEWMTGTTPFPGEGGIFGGGLALLLLLAALVVWKGRKLLPARVLVQSPSFEQRQVVIALLSPCENLQRGAHGHWEVQKRFDRSAPWESLDGKTLEQLVGKHAGVSDWNWQQTLRAAYYHKDRLKRVVLVGSVGVKGSGTASQLEMAKAFIETWFPGTVKVYGEPEAPGQAFDSRWQADFEKLDDVINLLRNILRELQRDTAGFTHRDIVIDCTGGFKVASIAAAMVTLDRPELVFQYVGTGEHAGQVIGFDVATEHFG